MTKNIIITLIVLALFGIGGFLYVTRAPSAPTKSIESVAKDISIAKTTQTAPSSSVSSAGLYRISSKNSTVEFGIDEILSGSPKHVVGTTGEIAGEVGISAQGIVLGTVKVNAKTFKTDDSCRDGAIVRLILKSEDAGNEFITFKPTTIKGAPSTLTSGDRVNLTVLGDLTISGVTKPTTFTVTGKVEGDTLSGSATATLKRSDFKLVIPNFSFIANVTDTFTVKATIFAGLVQGE